MQYAKHLETQLTRIAISKWRDNHLRWLSLFVYLHKSWSTSCLLKTRSEASMLGKAWSNVKVESEDVHDHTRKKWGKLLQEYLIFSQSHNNPTKEYEQQTLVCKRFKETYKRTEISQKNIFFFMTYSGKCYEVQYHSSTARNKKDSNTATSFMKIFLLGRKEVPYWA